MDCLVCHQPISEKRLKGYPGVETCSALCTNNKRHPKKQPPLEITRDCETCGNPIPVERLNRCDWAKTCSPECSKRRGSVLYRQNNPQRRSLPTGTVGAISELRVAADLLQRGYAVFRALSPSCPCDLAILWDNRLFKMEVKTASRSGFTNKVTYSMSSNRNSYDILAAVLPDEIVYVPALPEYSA